MVSDQRIANFLGPFLAQLDSHPVTTLNQHQPHIFGRFCKINLHVFYYFWAIFRWNVHEFLEGLNSSNHDFPMNFPMFFCIFPWFSNIFSMNIAWISHAPVPRRAAEVPLGPPRTPAPPARHGGGWAAAFWPRFQMKVGPWDLILGIFSGMLVVPSANLT